MTRSPALAGLDAEALHLRPRLRAGAGRAGDADRGPAGRFRRLPAEEFRHGLPGRRQRPPGAATVAQRAGHPPARRGRAGAARSRASARPASRPCCRPARRRASPSGLAASASRCAISCSSTPGSPMAARAKAPARRHRSRGPAPLADGTVLDARPPGRSPTSCPASSRREARRARGIAYKTGTSYGYRDAWSVGFDGRYVLGVWVGRADCGGGSRPVRL